MTSPVHIPRRFAPDGCNEVTHWVYEGYDAGDVIDRNDMRNLVGKYTCDITETEVRCKDCQD